MRKRKTLIFFVPFILICTVVFSLHGCAMAKGDIYMDPIMDFASLQTIAVMPFENLSGNMVASGRVRDVFMTKLLATGAVYVTPPGEVSRGAYRVGIQAQGNPTPEEIVKLAGIIKVNAIITGVVREYGEVRSGSAVSNAVSISLMMFEAQTGKVIWSASVTRGGVGVWDRLFGGGGEPMNNITEKAVDDLIEKLFK